MITNGVSIGLLAHFKRVVLCPTWCISPRGYTDLRNRKLNSKGSCVFSYLITLGKFILGCKAASTIFEKKLSFFNTLRSAVKSVTQAGK